MILYTKYEIANLKINMKLNILWQVGIASAVPKVQSHREGRKLNKYS